MFACSCFLFGIICQQFLPFIHHSGLGCGIYTTNTPDACHFVAADARVNIVVAENDNQVQKFYKVSISSVISVLVHCSLLRSVLCCEAVSCLEYGFLEKTLAQIAHSNT